MQYNTDSDADDCWVSGTVFSGEAMPHDHLNSPLAVGFKIPAADLHRRSSRIFLVCLAIAVATTVILLTLPLPAPEPIARRVEPPPVIIHLENIPETRQVPAIPAPATPLRSFGAPIAIDDLLPDEVTIEDTDLDLTAVPEQPAITLVPSPGAVAEEQEIFEYYDVEEIPEPLNRVVPEYPPIAERAGIEGAVVLNVLVTVEGMVDSVEVVEGPEVFRASAIAAARRTTFSPARFNDRAVACWVIIPYRFEFQR